MHTKSFFFDGASVKSMPLSALNDDQIFTVVNGAKPAGKRGDISTVQAFDGVPWFFRAVDIRAKAVASMPFALMRKSTDVTDDPALASLVRTLRRNLYRTEAALCIYGAAYWVRETNRYGMNESLRWIVPTTVKPKFNAGGVSGFERKLPNEENPRLFQPSEMIYFWTPSLTADLGPGTPCGVVALAAAGVLSNLDVTMEAFFKRGLIQATLLQVDGNPQKGELEKLEAWWRRMLAGVQKAWEVFAVRGDIKPVVIGSTPRDATAVELTTQKREDVATSFGIPHSLLFSDAANFATAYQDDIHFHTKTVVPECETVIAEPLNEQYLEPLGLTLEFQPKKLEIFQQAELTKAQGVAQLVGRPILTVNEGRELIDYDPIDGGDELQKPAPDLASLLAGQRSQASNPPTPKDNPPDTEAMAKALDLDKWQRKAIKALGRGKSPAVGFESDYIQDDESQAIAGRLATAHTAEEVKAAFAAPFRSESWESYG